MKIVIENSLVPSNYCKLLQFKKKNYLFSSHSYICTYIKNIYKRICVKQSDVIKNKYFMKIAYFKGDEQIERSFLRAHKFDDWF